MANWCTNTVNIYFKNEEDSKEFIEFIKSDELDFDMRKMIPNGDWGCPKRLDGGFKSPQVNFEVNTQGEHLDGYLIEVIFRTAWNPPTKIFELLREKFNTCFMKWHYNTYESQQYGYLEHMINDESYDFKLGTNDCSITIGNDEVEFQCVEEGNISNPFVFKRRTQ
jgi:hypothetical protein